MTLKTFVDTVAWIALVNTRDSLHQKAKGVFLDLREGSYHFVTTEFVLLEFANALSSPDFRGKASDFVEGLKNMTNVEIIPASSDLFASGFELNKDYYEAQEKRFKDFASQLRMF